MNTIAMAIDAFMLTLPRYGLFYYNTRFVTLQAFLRGYAENLPTPPLSVNPPVFPKNRETFGHRGHLFAFLSVYTV